MCDHSAVREFPLRQIPRIFVFLTSLLQHDLTVGSRMTQTGSDVTSQVTESETEEEEGECQCCSLFIALCLLSSKDLSVC